MKGLNKVMLIGRLGRDPELRYTPSGQAYAKFSMATDETWTDKNGEKKTKTEWHNIVAWGKLSEICNQFLKKGRLVYVEGRIQTRQWEDNTGAKRQITEISIADMILLESKGAHPADGFSHDGPTAPAPGGGVAEPPAAPGRNEIVIADEPITDDDVPF